MSTLALGAEPGRGRRWALCFALVAFLHAAPALIAFWWLAPIDFAVAPPPAAVMIDMEPLPAPVPVAPPHPQPRIESPPVPDVPAAPKPAVALPRTPPHPAPRHEEAPPKPDLPAAAEPAAAPVSEPAPPAPAPAPPAPVSTAEPTWRGLLLGRLEQFKRYPALAQARRQQGVVYLRFVMDRDGKVVSSRIDRSAGYPLLDEETQALLERAQPLPKPPPEIGGDTIELVVPIEYFLRGRG